MECPICYEELNEDKVCVISCNHRFCIDCVSKLSLRSINYCCPLCRRNSNALDDIINNVSIKELYEMYVSAIDSYESRRLYVSKDLYDIIGFILISKNKGKQLLDYLLIESDDREFKSLHKNVSDGNTYFEKIKDPIYSFALALLYYKYH